MKRIQIYTVCCANCKHCIPYGRMGHNICEKDGKIYRGSEPAWTTCDEFEPI